MFSERAVVANLETAKVTWANTYLLAASKSGIQVTSDCFVDKDRIFIGDHIPIHKIEDERKHIYFLAASSISPSDSSFQPEIDLEFENINWSDLTLLVSNAEKDKILSGAVYLEDQVMVNGFPINITELYGFKTETKEMNSICFLGQTREIKNIDFEIKLVERFKRLGFDIYHLSSGNNSQKKSLEKSGCRVVEGVRFEEYWNLVSRFQYFMSTSFYESLSVAGIEATVLGCIPVVPNHSGFVDWCPRDFRYDPFDIENVLDIVMSIEDMDVPQIDLNWYDTKNYFGRVGFLP